MSDILVTGSKSGLGELIKHRLQEHGHTVYDYDIRDGLDVRSPDLRGINKLDVLINCAGTNIIDWLEDVQETDWYDVMSTNAEGIYMMTQACLSMLAASKGTVLNIISNASHVPMTCSLAYNASKGAAHIMTLQMARELTKRHGITVFGVSPNKLKDTDMSRKIEDQVCRTRGWTAEEAHEYQRTALLTGEETPPDYVAEFVAFLLRHKFRHKYLTGCVIPYGA